MTYVLGDAAASGSPLRLQNTVKGDDFYSLAAAYFGAPTVANGQKIIAMQPELRGVAITKASIQRFVKSRPGWSAEGGGLRPYVASDNPGTVGADGKPEGYAIFTADTQLMLPDMPRLDGKVPKGPPVAAPKPKTSGVKDAGLGWAALGIGLGSLLLLWPKKKKPSPKPVQF